MEDLRLQFIKKSGEFVARWYEETVKGFVAEDSENTLRIGKEKLSVMKVKVKELSTKAEEVANEVLSHPSLWWHLAPSDQDIISPYEQFAYRFPEIIDKPIRRALGKVGTILEEFGYKVNTKPVYSGIGGTSWYEYPTVSSYSVTNPVPYYPFRFVWSNEMQSTLKSYNELYKQACRLYSEIKTLQKQKKTKEATDLWDSAS